MKQLIRALTLNKEFVFNGQMEEFKEILKKSNLNYETLSEREIKFTPTISWGTLTFGGGFSIGISVRALLSDLGPDRLKINLRTSVRPEHYFLIVVFIVFFINAISDDESKGMFIYVFVIWIVCHLWFQFIYRLQENSLADKVVKRLRLFRIR